MGRKRFIIRTVALPLFVALVLPTVAGAQPVPTPPEADFANLTLAHLPGKPKMPPMHGKKVLGTYSTRRQLVGGRRRRRKSV